MSWQDTYANQLLSPKCAPTVVPVALEAKLGCDADFDWDSVLTLDMIRTHTKTDDVPSVTDDQLRLYRRAALESAEQYTGMYFKGVKVVTESVDRKWSKRDLCRGTYKYQTLYPISDGIVYLYGAKDGLGNATIRVTPGTRNIKLPITQTALDLGGDCCRPVCGGEINYGIQIMYRAGYEKCDCVPAGIIVGMLKFIAWNITHPGDELLTVRNKESGEAGQARGTNNIAWASGALELWRQYDPDAI